MKILFYRYNSICEPDIIQAFRDFSLDVVEMFSPKSDQNMTAADQINNLKTMLDKHDFLFVFSINFFPLVSDLCMIYQIPYVCWSVDSPLVEIYAKSISNQTNRVFLFDRQQLVSLQKLHISHAFHLPLATNPQRWTKVIQTITPAERRQYSHDISFIGSLYTEKDPYLDITGLSDYAKGFIDSLLSTQLKLTGQSILAESLTEPVIRELIDHAPGLYAVRENCIMNPDRYVASEHILGMHASSLYRIQSLKEIAKQFQLAVYTQSDTSVLGDSPNLHFCGSAATLTEMPKIFHLSKINLNMTIYPIQSGLSLRVWDVLGCGGFLLTNLQPELEEYLTPGKDLETYSCLDELLDKCKYYLSHDSQREQIANNGYQTIVKYNTWKNRLEFMLKTILQTLDS